MSSRTRSGHRLLVASALLGTVFTMVSQVEAATILLDQDFESPNSFVSTSDVDGRPVNVLYANQPTGFSFGNTFTVETVNVTDSVNPSDSQRSFGSIGGYQGDLAQSGNFVVGMLSSVQDDRLGLTFDTGGFRFLNIQIDITSLDLDCCGAPFIFADGVGYAPTFRFSLFDDSGSSGVGTGALLDQFELAGTESQRHVLDFTTGTFGLDASGSTDGIVTLQIDLLTGGYAAFDNLIVASSDTEGDVGQVSVPLPPTGWLLLGALVALCPRLARRAARI